MNLLVLGTCRAHRIFLKDRDGIVYDNTQGRITPIFSKCGYLHTAFEIRQTLEFFLESRELDFSNDICKLIFRKEPIRTTPGNTFNAELENSISNNSLYKFSNFPEFSSVLLEISSLQYQIHNDSGYYLHTNPNFINNFTYPEIYPDGYYHKAGYLDEVSVSKMTVDQFDSVFMYFASILEGKKVFIMGHLVDPDNRNPVRVSLNKCLKEAALKYGFIYVDTEPFVRDYGFLTLSTGSIDIHHLSHEGECALGTYIIDLVNK